MPNPKPLHWQRSLGNPAPLGLYGFGLATAMIGFRNAALVPAGGSGPAVMAMGLWAGGLAQLATGVLEYVKGNGFGLAAFFLYGCFWVSLVWSELFPLVGAFPAPATATAAGTWFFLWGVFTFLVWAGTFSKPVVLQLLFLLLAVLYMLLALGVLLGPWGKPSAATVFVRLAGYWAIVTGFTSIYLAAAEMNGWPTVPPQQPWIVKPLSDLELP
eukprot:m51a1_g5032 hypothetical protein (214) ;mRNA; f:368595-369320